MAKNVQNLQILWLEWVNEFINDLDLDSVSDQGVGQIATKRDTFLKNQILINFGSAR